MAVEKKMKNEKRGKKAEGGKRGERSLKVTNVKNLIRKSDLAHLTSPEMTIMKVYFRHC